MKTLRLLPSFTLALCLFAATSTHIRACLWDSDTLATEVSRFPGVFEMITGQFPRHSNEFYEWRIQQAKQVVTENPQSFAAYDDWAVAEHKLGRNQEAIRIMNQALALAPKRYESLSNLGTFHLFEGNLAKSCELLREALLLNPDAHFGREKYQLWLADLLLRQKTAVTADETTAPQDQAPLHDGGGKMKKDLDAFLKERSETKFEAEGQGRSAQSADSMLQAQRQEAVTAVLGMMRFARHDHPLLLETLGDLLAAGGYKVDANRLAAFAYLRASQTSQSSIEQDRLNLISKQLISGSHGSSMSFETLWQQLSEGLAKGDELQAQVRADELAWIRERKDAQAEFEKKYLK
jgi:tetratricopeptide (TPR) repeat protein